ncbi:MAG TPA: sulfatase-like hydrolase/transferase [Thermoanaerobaculia bacterium]|jgi:arylsulfatase A-like enzyme/Flp pilus assembly protein TadD|nr:sulfatase-like hydrolase/transferase [Thermoanaerobaculia bacterium]
MLKQSCTAVSILAVFLLAAAVSAQSAKAPARPAASRDIVLITIDTLRADAPGFAGNKRSQTPVLDRLAAQGRVFTNAHAHNVVTLPSHTNILTGLYPFQHGVRDNSGFVLPESIPTLATVLHGAGYATGAFVGAFPLDSQFGLDHGFDVYDDHYPEGADEEEFVIAERRGDEVVRLALSWWQKQKGKPRFLWVHLYDPHAAYEPPEPFASRFRDNPYLGEVAAADSFLAPLLGPFLDGKEKPALVVVTGDHGEALGEHGEETHGLFAYEATLKVPLVVWGRGVAPGRDARPARHVDIFPSILQVAGVNAPGGFRRPGRSLLAPPVAGDSDSYFESLSTTLNRGWAPLRGLLRNGRKFIALPLPEVYDLPKDPGEKDNRFDEERTAARGVFAALPRESAWPPQRGTLKPEDEARLRSLGYLSGSAAAKESYGPEDDPKRLIGLDRKVHQVIDLYMRGRLDESTRLARELVTARPTMSLGHSLLAQSLLQAGKTREALDVMLAARKTGATSDAMLRQLGLTLSEVGRAGEAVNILKPLADAGDPQSLNAYGLALSEAGRQKEAFETFQRVLRDDPDNPKAWEQLGLVELRLGHWPQARDRSRKALELNGRLPFAWNNLGVALYQSGQKDEAIDAWQKAVDLKPDLWDALWNLGTKAAERGRMDQARKALERFAAGAPPDRYGPDVEKARAFLKQARDRDR